MVSTTSTPEEVVYSSIRSDSVGVAVGLTRIFFFDFSVSTTYSEPLTIPGGADLGRHRVIDGTQKIIFLVQSPTGSYTSSYFLYDTGLAILDSFNIKEDFISTAVNSQKNMGVTEIQNDKNKYVIDITVPGSTQIATYSCEKDPKAFDIAIDPEDGNFFVSKTSTVYSYKLSDGTAVSSVSVSGRPQNMIYIPGTMMMLVTAQGSGATAFNYETHAVEFSYTFTAGAANENSVSFELGTRMALFSRYQSKVGGQYELEEGPCHSTCDGCSATDRTGTGCTACATGLAMVGGLCVSCPATNFFSDGTNCVACHPSCKTCSGSASNQCLSCNSNYGLDSGSCTCPMETYDTANDPIVDPNVCASCHANCSVCSGLATNCSACKAGKVLEGTNCLDSCSAGKVLEGTNCLDSCSAGKVLEGINCLDSCSAGKLLEGSNCLDSCSAGKVLEGSNCLDSCSAGKVLEGTNCLDSCSAGKLLDGTNCLDSCSAGKVLEGTNCLDSCSAGKVLEGTNCIDSCSAGKVLEGINCLDSCSTGKVLEGSNCLDSCSAGKVLEGTNCLDSCSAGKVLEGTNCLDSCSAGKLLEGTNCLDSCSAGNEDNGSGVCVSSSSAPICSLDEFLLGTLQICQKCSS